MAWCTSNIHTAGFLQHLSNGHTYWTKFLIPQNITNSYLKGYIHASGSIPNTVTLKLYDADKCPSPDSTGNIDFGRCSSPLLSGDYLQAQEILKYIDLLKPYTLINERRNSNIVKLILYFVI